MIANIGMIVSSYFPLFLKGAGMTIVISLLCVLLGTLLGTLTCLMRMSRFRILRGIAIVYIEIIRGTPLLLQLFVFAFGLPAMGIKIPIFFAAVVALSLNSGAYVAEIIRSGIQSIDPGQMEAARSLGMNSKLAMSRIVLPQAIRNILPALGNEFVMLIKESSLGSTFFVGELMTVQKTITGINFLVMEPLLVIAVFYFIMTFTLGRVLGVVERRLSQGD